MTLQHRDRRTERPFELRARDYRKHRYWDSPADRQQIGWDHDDCQTARKRVPKAPAHVTG